MKHIVVTGTSRGIGRELAQQLAKSGHRVLALSRKIPEGFSHPDIECLSVDLTTSEGIDAVKSHLSNWPQVDALIHNAGFLINKPFGELAREDFEAVYRVNVFAVAQLTQAVLPLMQSGSHVVSISSMGGIQGSVKFPGLAAYSSSKGALITLSELLAEEYRPRGIAFNVLALGAVQTEMLAEAFPGYQAPHSAAEMAAYIADFALNGQNYFNGKILQVSSSTP
jgi:NAD(P)-dependent dehydrogenase (short-subunit alcohol dehydrogenase family)